MICYKDMTFCTAKACIHFGDGKCHRSLTESVMERAKEWWGDIDGEPPIAIFVDTPACYQLEEKD